MEKQVLVAFGSKHGATAEIAEKIGDGLRQAGLSTDVLPVDRVGDLDAYGAVVLGSAVYVGQWRKEASRFLKANEAVLAGKPVWLFSSGPTGEGDPAELTEGWRLPEKLRPIAEHIAPRDTALFHGSVDPGELGLLERWMIKTVGAPTGDYRDWAAIADWAAAIAAQLQGGAPA